MTSSLTLSAALLLGLGASGHCVAMCGGISAALSLATARNAHGRPRGMLLIAYQLGRVSSYTLAGLLLGGAFGALIAWLDIAIVRQALRTLAALAMLAAALVSFGLVRDPGGKWGNRLWAHLAPLGRRLLPVSTLPRAWAFGMIWGWMPCGFVYTVLLVATAQSNARAGAATMAAFGLGTLPALLATACGAERFARQVARPGARRLAGVLLLIAAAITLVGPWVMHAMPRSHVHHDPAPHASTAATGTRARVDAAARMGFHRAATDPAPRRASFAAQHRGKTNKLLRMPHSPVTPRSFRVRETGAASAMTRG